MNLKKKIGIDDKNRIKSLYDLYLFSHIKSSYNTPPKHAGALRKELHRNPEHILHLLCNSYTMGCLPVCGDNPRALARGLTYVQLDKNGITILYRIHQCRPCPS